MEVLNHLTLPKELTSKYQDAIRKNLSSLMRSTGINQTRLVAELEQRGILYNQGNLSQFLSGKKSIQLGVIVHLCDIYQVSLSELVDENFAASREASGDNGYVQKLYSDDLILHLPYLGEAFVTDPCCPEFQGYLQTYHFYMQPTRSYEKKLLTGTLRLEACGSVCEAYLDLNTNKIAEGKPLHKHYRGRVIISKAIDAVYVLLTSPIEGELSVISFRHFHLPHQPLDCRIAAVLTNESGEFHSPTMHRMFLSRTPIAPEHLPLLVPHLQLNSSNITIPRDWLERFRRNSEEYAELLDALTMFRPSETFYWSEDYVIGVARHFLTKDQIPVFLSRIREISLHDSSNKASRRADMLARDLLMSLNYFHDHDI